MSEGDLYIARLDMVIKPMFVNDKFIDAVSWNAAIECAMKQFIDSQMYYGYDAYKLIRKLKK